MAQHWVHLKPSAFFYLLFCAGSGGASSSSGPGVSPGDSDGVVPQVQQDLGRREHAPAAGQEVQREPALAQCGLRGTQGVRTVPED